jgi:hypothetical protein
MQSLKKWLIGLAIIALLVAIAIGVAFWRAESIERHRVADATLAFKPLEKALGCEILSSPTPFNRYCNYIVMFPPGSLLSDDNVKKLQSLTLLPKDNWLEVEISTLNITDAAIPILSELSNLKSLDVTKSAITDEGIEHLQQALAHTQVIKRKK